MSGCLLMTYRPSLHSEIPVLTSFFCSVAPLIIQICSVIDLTDVFRTTVFKFTKNHTNWFRCFVVRCGQSNILAPFFASLNPCNPSPKRDPILLSQCFTIHWTDRMTHKIIHGTLPVTVHASLANTAMQLIIKMIKTAV